MPSPLTPTPQDPPSCSSPNNHAIPTNIDIETTNAPLSPPLSPHHSPTNNNQLTNGAGYINEAAQTIHTNAIGNAIDFSARVTLDGGVAEGTSGIIKNLQNIL